MRVVRTLGVQTVKNSLGIRFDLVEISKKARNCQTFCDCWPKSVLQLKKMVVPDEGENWGRQSGRHNETIDIRCTTQVVTHQQV